MMSLLLAALLVACQEEPPKIVPGEATVTKWRLSGPAEVDNETELSVRARRVIRRWDANMKMFNETLSDEDTLRTMIVALNKRFEGAVRAGTAGRYSVNVSDERKLLFSEKLTLGPVEPLFGKGPDDMKALLECRDKAVEFLDEIERILARQIENSQKHRDDYLKRVSVWSQKVEELIKKSDFTGTGDVLKVCLFHIRNVQVWEEKALPPASSNDPIRQKKKLFMDLDLTIEGLRKTLDSIPMILSYEAKVSTCLVLERLIAQAGENERRKEFARAAARAASKLAEAAPIPDKELVGILDQAADRSTDAAEIRATLYKAGISLVIP